MNRSVMGFPFILLFLFPHVSHIFQSEGCSIFKNYWLNQQSTLNNASNSIIFGFVFTSHRHFVLPPSISIPIPIQSTLHSVCAEARTRVHHVIVCVLTLLNDWRVPTLCGIYLVFSWHIQMINDIRVFIISTRGIDNKCYFTIALPRSLRVESAHHKMYTRWITSAL